MEATIKMSSHLCTACGLCCQGMFHDHAQVQIEEASSLQALGFEIRKATRGLVFSLPCSHLWGSQCSVYESRPLACRGYQCRLLCRYLSGDVSLDQALATVQQVQRLRDQILQKLGPIEPTKSLWQHFHAQDLESLDPDTSLDIVSIVALSRRHFEARRGEVR